MKTSAAKTCVALLKSNWPTPEIPHETEIEWTTNLEVFRFDVDDFRDAIRIVYEQGRMFCPHPSEVAVLAEELWRDRMAARTPALPPPSEPASNYISFRDWLDNVATPEQRAIAARSGLEVKIEEAS